MYANAVGNYNAGSPWFGATPGMACLSTNVRFLLILAKPLVRRLARRPRFTRLPIVGRPEVRRWLRPGSGPGSGGTGGIDGSGMGPGGCGAGPGPGGTGPGRGMGGTGDGSGTGPGCGGTGEGSGIGPGCGGTGDGSGTGVVIADPFRVGRST